MELPVGIGDELLEPASLVIHPGDHVLVAGPSRSGRSTALAAIAATVRVATPGTWIGAVTPRRSALPAEACDAMATTLAGLGRLPRDGWLLLDDAELVDDPDRALAGVLARAEPGLCVVAAGRADALRMGYGHWTQLVRRSRLGVLLQPDVLVDGDLLGVTLPRHRPVPHLPGRGYLVGDGRVELVQLAIDDGQAGAADPSTRPAAAPIDRRAAASTARAPALLAGPAARIIAAPANDRAPAST